MSSAHLALRDQPHDTVVIIDDHTASPRLLRTGYDYEARHGYLNNGLTPAVWARVYSPNHPGTLQRIPLDQIVLVPDQDTDELALAASEQVPA